MDDERPSQVLGALPRTRPHRRSQKRPRTAANGPPGKRPQPSGKRPQPSASRSPDQTADSPGTTETRTPPRATAQRSPDRADDAHAAGREATEIEDKPRRLSHPAQPEGLPPTPRIRKPLPPTGSEILATAVQATAELAEIGLTVSARALRNAASRLRKP